MRIYLDTSALVKQFSSEEGSDIINTTFQKCHEGELILVTSYWSLLEAMAAIVIKSSVCQLYYVISCSLD